MGLIKELWITLNGVVIFSRNSGNVVNTQLFGAYLTALDQFSSQISSNGVQEFELGKLRFMLERVDPLIFIINAPPKAKIKKVQKELKNLAEQFIEAYPMEFINKWDGNTVIFETFAEKLDKSIDETIDTFEKGIW